MSGRLVLYFLPLMQEDHRGLLASVTYQNPFSGTFTLTCPSGNALTMLFTFLLRSIIDSLSLSQRSPLICGVNFLRLWPFFYSIILSFFGVGLPAYLINQNPFSRSTFLLGLTSFLLSCIGATGAYSFSKSEMGFYVCAV